jgi:hypothetical protein
MREQFFLDGFHALPVERAGVLDGLLSNFAEARVFRGVVGVGGLAVEDAARAELLTTAAPNVCPAEMKERVVAVLKIRKFSN